MFIKRPNGWQIRSGVVANGEALTAEHYTDSLQDGLIAIERWHDKSLIPADDKTSSNQEWLPKLTLPVEASAVKKVEKQLKDGFGVVIWGLQKYSLWFSVCGTDEELFNREWTLGEANQDIVLALGGLKVRTAMGRRTYTKGMKHSQNPRLEDGRVAGHQLGTRGGDRRIQEHRDRIERHETFLSTPEGEKWKKLIRRGSIKKENK